jgi:phosphate:Na+ symporter
MEILTNVFKLSAGIGLFLFAMYLLEESLKNLSGRNFKLFLQRITKNRVGAVSGGAIVTGVLQSSSMVSLLVLAFVGAGVFTMKNALAIILGANLGSTFGNWFVATIGFKFNIEIIAYPAVCLGGLLLIIYSKRVTIKNISYLLLGFGLLFIALSFMKIAVEEQVKLFDFSKYLNMPSVFFLFIGFFITLLVQSSSVTMALTLAALNANVIHVFSAALVILGSETGTTIKMVLGALGSNTSKKRIVFGNLIFNIFLTCVSFIFLKSIIFLITNILNITDPLIVLVAFSSIINLFSIIIFLPFLDYFVLLLEKLIKDTDSSITAFIGQASNNDPETALNLFQKETAYFINNCMLFNLALFKIDTTLFEDISNFKNSNLKQNYFSKSSEEKYEFLKKLQGEIHVSYLDIRLKLQGTNSAKINRLISSVRSAMYSVKSIKDIGTNISNLQNSSKDIKFDFFLDHKKEIEKLYTELNVFLKDNHRVSYEVLKKLFIDIEHNYSSSLNNFYTNTQKVLINNLDITTAINFNRELFTSNKALLMSVKDFLLDEKQAEEFNEIPVYRT